MRLRDLGALSVDVDGVERSPGGTRPAALLALLVVHANERVPVDAVVDALWGDAATAGSMSTLESHVWRLRKVLEPHRPAREAAAVLVNQAGGYRLVVAPQQVDSLRFAELADEIADLIRTGQPERALRRCDEALSLWRGRPWGPMADAPWAAAAVARLEEQRRLVRLRRIDGLLAVGQAERALVDIGALVHEMPHDEVLRTQQMLALYRCGRVEDSLAAYLDTARTLRAEIGVDPGAELREMHRRVLAQDPALDLRPAAAAATPADASVADASVAEASVPPREVYLPGRTSLILGRERELDDVERILIDRRLVTLVGPAGAGKTRLGVEIAARSAPSFPDGVWFVDLAAITDHSLIASTVASATGLQPSAPGGLVEALAAFLNGRSGLLVLDNCEHLMPTVSDVVSTIAGGGGEVTVLATSREPLGLTGERLVTVDPLDVGDAGAVGATAPAVELFLQRARDVAADRLTALAPGAILELARRICEAVDGLPLAIELAAARLQAYSLVEIEEQVRTDPSRLSRPTGRTGDRGSSLRAALDASERLLTDAERRLHRELTVLPGPFTVDAALGVSGTAALTDASADAGDPADVLPLLVGRSLLAVVSPSRPDGPSRFRQLATVRAHAARGLDTRAAAHHRWRRQDWVLNLVGRGPRLGSFAQADWFTALDDDLTTVRAVLEDCFLPTESLALGSGSSAAAIGVVLSNGLVDYWYYRSQTAEAAEWLERAVRAVLAGAVVDVADETLALEAAASIRCLQGRGDRAAPLVDRLLDAAPGVSAARRAEVGHALGRLATAVWSTDDIATMRRVHTAMTAISDGVDDPALKVFVDAVDCLIELPATAPAQISRRAAGIYAAAVDSDHAYAAWSAAGACAVAAIQKGNAVEGLKWTDRIIDIHRRLGVRRGGWYLETRADLTSLAGDHERAAALFAAARAHNKRGGIAWPRRAWTTELQQRTEQALGAERFARAWRRGESWSLADVAAAR